MEEKEKWEAEASTKWVWCQTCVTIGGCRTTAAAEGNGNTEAVFAKKPPLSSLHGFVFSTVSGPVSQMCLLSVEKKAAGRQKRDDLIRRNPGEMETGAKQETLVRSRVSPGARTHARVLPVWTVCRVGSGLWGEQWRPRHADSVWWRGPRGGAAGTSGQHQWRSQQRFRNFYRYEAALWWLMGDVYFPSCGPFLFRQKNNIDAILRNGCQVIKII